MSRRLSPVVRQYVDAVFCLACAVAFIAVFFVALDSL
jgi:hypothetical protein